MIQQINRTLKFGEEIMRRERERERKRRKRKRREEEEERGEESLWCKRVELELQYPIVLMSAIIILSLLFPEEVGQAGSGMEGEQ